MVALDLPTLAIIAIMLLIYFVLGCVMESLAIVLLTLPVFVPVILALDLGMNDVQTMVWFGILVLVSVEVGMISPPFGLNLFVIQAVARSRLEEVVKGAWPFAVMMLATACLLWFWPSLTLYIAYEIF